MVELRDWVPALYAYRHATSAASCFVLGTEKSSLRVGIFIAVYLRLEEVGDLSLR